MQPHPNPDPSTLPETELPEGRVNTPINPLSLNGIGTFSTIRNAPNAKHIAHLTLRDQLATAMEIRELSVEDWLHQWMLTSAGPGANEKLDGIVSHVTFNVDLRHTEREMYAGLREGFNRLIGLITQDESKRLTAYITGDHAAGDDDEFEAKPDLILYPGHAADTIKIPPKHSRNDEAKGKSKDQAQDELTKAKTVWAFADIVIEAKFRRELRAFYSMDKAPFNETAECHKKARGQILEYANELLMHQHRIFAPIIYVFQNEARFLAVNRSGASVSEPFKYTKDLKPLAAFLQRYITAEPLGRGFDPTASLASQADHETFVQLKTRYPDSSHLHNLFDKAATPEWPTYVLRIYQPLSSSSSAPPLKSVTAAKEYLIGRPQSRSKAIIGRGTRSYAAWDRVNQRPVFIKDYWRPLKHGLSEHQIYVKFSQGRHPVTNIPTIVGGGDVYSVDSEYQTTRTPDGHILDSERVHTRLVMQEVGRPLESFKDWRELTSVVHDALKAHQKAWVHHGVLHRDLSVGNIIIYDEVSKAGVTEPETIGLLSDWDLAKTKKEVLNPRPSQESRSGTWQFMSAAVQWWPHKPHLLSDDLESVMHIMNWLVLKYMKTELSRSPADLANYLNTVYDFADENGNSCSFQKYEKVRDGTRFAPVLSEYRDHPFTKLLDKLRELCHLQYRAIDPERPTKEHLAACREGSTTAPLNTHDAMLNAFREALDNPAWPHIPKLEDQVRAFQPASSYTPNKRRGDPSLEVEREAKRKPTGTSSGKTKTSASADQAESGSASTSARMAPPSIQPAESRKPSKKLGTGERKK